MTLKQRIQSMPAAWKQGVLHLTGAFIFLCAAAVFLHYDNFTVGFLAEWVSLGFIILSGRELVRLFRGN